MAHDGGRVARHITALKDFAVRVGRNPVLEDELAQMIQKLPPQSLHDISRIANHMILNPSVPRTHAMREIVKHMYEVGLRYPSEVTMGYLSILVSLKEYEGLEVEKFPAFFQYHQQMKNEIVSHLESLRKKAHPGENTSLLMILPENPEDLHYQG